MKFLILVACIATTNIPELEEKTKNPCTEGLISIDLSGDHDTLVETLVLDKDLGGRNFSELTLDPTARGMTKATRDGFEKAMQSAKIMEAIYPSRRFIWQVRDKMNRPFCHFTITDEETIGKCTNNP